ncbi:hypothetical protein EMIT0P218_40374 [Pseudomonas sp. IT-P218]
MASSRAGPLPHLIFSEHRFYVRLVFNVGAGLLAKAVDHPTNNPDETVSKRPQKRPFFTKTAYPK